jgi:membrane protein
VFATASTALSIINALFAKTIPVPHFIVKGLDLFVGDAMVPALLLLVYRFVPDAPVAWRDVWIGAVVTSVLFFAGKYAFAMYLRSNVMLSVYGAAGSLVVFLVWVYYSAQVFFLGAELTKVYAVRYGSRRPL